MGDLFPNRASGSCGSTEDEGGERQGSSIYVFEPTLVNAFRPELTGGRDIGLFVREVLGFEVALPEALTKHIEAGKTEKPSLGFSLPLSNGMAMNITIGEGLINNEPSIIMDATVAATKPTAPDQDALMAAFNGARGVIHEMFLDMTKPIYSLMQPEGAA